MKSRLDPRARKRIREKVAAQRAEMQARIQVVRRWVRGVPTLVKLCPPGVAQGADSWDGSLTARPQHHHRVNVEGGTMARGRVLDQNDFRIGA